MNAFRVLRICISSVILMIALGANAATTYTETVNGIKWTYTVSKGETSVGGGSINSKAINTSTSGIITIPSTLGGYTVTCIADYAFYYCDKLTKVTIPSAVTKIGNSSFGACTRLKTIYIPSAVAKIGTSAFSDCALTSVEIPSSVTIIEDSCFARCTSLTNVLIPNGVLTIGANAFIGCSSLKSVTIPDSVLTIGGGAFSVCDSLEAFVVSENNSSYKAVDGLLMTKDGRSLVAASGKISTIDIPKGVINIADNAFLWAHVDKLADTWLCCRNRETCIYGMSKFGKCNDR